MDTDLLAILKEKSAFLRFRPYIKEHVLSKEAQLIFNTLDSFYKHYPSVTDVDWTAFESYFFVLRNASIRREAAPNYKAVFEKLRSYTPSVAAEDVLKHYITQDYAHRIADTALQVREGTAHIDDVSELVSQHDKELGRAITPSDLFVTGGIGEVLKRASMPGFEWRLEELNISLGPLRVGDFVIVVAYVETGKTTFVADQIAHMATQIKDGRPVVWINNEERSDKVKLRVMQAALGRTLHDIMANEAKAEADYSKLMGGADRILILNNDSGLNNAQKLTPLFRDLNPAIIVFDQLDKVGGFRNSDSAGEHERLGKLYGWARDLAHTYGPVIAVSQTDASGDGAKFIGMSQLRGSKVDKPGEADAIITIGRSTGPKESNKRYIHVPTNKLFGGARSNEADRHGYWEVEIRSDLARYEGTR